MKIRKRHPTDTEALKEVTTLAVAPLRLIYRPTQGGRALRSAKRNLREQIVCECNGKVAATVEYENQGDRCHIVGLLVHPKFQRQGVARSLVDHIAKIAQKQGKRALSINTIKQTGNATIFCRLGFKTLSESVADESLGESLINEPLIDVYMERGVVT